MADKFKAEFQSAQAIEGDNQQDFELEDKIDQILASDKFSIGSASINKPEQVAFRLQGALFEIMPQSQTDIVFDQQIRRLLPQLTDMQYDSLQKTAINKWMDIYE